LGETLSFQTLILEVGAIKFEPYEGEE